MTRLVPRANGLEVDLSPETFGEMRDSSDLIDRPEGLVGRIAEDGYAYLRGFWDRDEVTPIRAEVARILVEWGYVDPTDPLSLRCLNKVDVDAKREIATTNSIVRDFVRRGKTNGFLEVAWGEEVRALDFVGMRMVAPGIGTYPHGDIVYYSRGTPKLLTGWTPLGDISLELGGLLILEGSHLNRELRDDYCKRDVDEYCTNDPDAEKHAASDMPVWNGAITTDFTVLRSELGGRLLSADFQQGDLVLFGLTTIHGSLDNQTDCIRLSADPRYQPMSEPADHRYIGPSPIVNSAPSKVGRIC